MPTLTLRATKGSALTTSELDANFKRTVSQKVTTYACLVSDNRSVIECLHASTPFTVTLGDAATMVASETGDYEVTITNIGAAVVTVARAGADTIDGAATSLTLAENSAVTLQITTAGDYKVINRVGDLGAINTGNITVSGTINGVDIVADTVQKIAAVSGHIRAGSIQLLSTLSASDDLVLSTLTAENTFETVGPTGSGATNIWTSMDDIPATATAIICNGFVNGVTSGTSAATVELFATDGDSSATPSLTTKKVISFDMSAAGDSLSTNDMVIIPLNGSQVFKATWRESGTTSRIVALIYTGFITD